MRTFVHKTVISKTIGESAKTLIKYISPYIFFAFFCLLTVIYNIICMITAAKNMTFVHISDYELLYQCLMWIQSRIFSCVSFAFLCFIILILNIFCMITHANYISCVHTSYNTVEILQTVVD